MDQKLLDASRYRIYSISLDSRFADTYFGPNGTCVTGSCATNTNNGTSDFLIRMPSTLKNIMRISMASVELPNVERLFSCKNGNLTMIVTVDGDAAQTLTITSGNYSPTEMATELATILNAEYGAGAFTVTTDAVTGLLSIQKTAAPLAFTINWQSDVHRIAARRTEWGLGYYLGFRQKIVTSSAAGLMQGTAPIHFQPAAYYLLQLMIPDQVESVTHRLLDGASIPAFGKLCLRDNWYRTQFDDGANQLRKEYTFLTPVNVASIRVRLVDAYGDTVDLMDLDWSLTLEFYEVTNARVNHTISRSYERLSL